MSTKIKAVKDFSKSDFNKLDNKLANTQIANELASEKGFKSAQEFITATNADINSKSSVRQSVGKKQAKQFTQDLLLLCLYQYVESMTSIEYINYFSNMFDDGAMSEGNTKQYIQPLDTGADTFIDDLFIPDSITQEFVDVARLDMYEKNTQGQTVLKDNAYQFKKPLTIQEPLWYPYFMSGKLSDYIAQITSMMMRTYTFFKFNKLAKLLVSITPQKVITGTAKNIFTAFATEIIPEIENMTLLNSDYNIGASTRLVSTVDKENLLIVLPAKLLSTMRAGVLSQLYNAKYLSVEDNYLSSNVITLGDEITIPASTGLVTVDKTKPYIPDTQIIVIDKRAIRHLIQIERQESQSWAENMSIQFTLHIWGLYGVLPWFKMFKYNNPNLMTLPTAANEEVSPIDAIDTV